MWITFDQVEVIYLKPDLKSMLLFAEILRSEKCSLLYLHSFFDPLFSILPLLMNWLGLVPTTPILLEPSGEFSVGALRLKHIKKVLYISFCRALHLHQSIYWQASSDEEKNDIIRQMGIAQDIFVAPPITSVGSFDESGSCGASSKYELRNSRGQEAPSRSARMLTKQSGKLDIIFVSRISRMKNLDGALRMLKELKGDVRFNIFWTVGR